MFGTFCVNKFNIIVKFLIYHDFINGILYLKTNAVN